MFSKIYEADMSLNHGRKFGADPYYYNATFIHSDGRRALLRFTEEQIQSALDRGYYDADGAKPEPEPTWVPKWVRRLQEKFR